MPNRLEFASAIALIVCSGLNPSTAAILPQLVLREPPGKPLTESRPDMPGHDWEVLKELFHGALPKSPQERTAYLERACNDDLSLRQAVESLLRSHEETGNFVDVPAYQAAAELLREGIKLEQGTVVGHSASVCAATDSKRS